MTKILVISDSHGNDEVMNDILLKHRDCDIKVHAGDSYLEKEEILSIFTYAVAGNNDNNNLPFTVFFYVENIKVCLCHSHTIATPGFRYVEKLAEFAKTNNCDLLIHGHSHYALDSYINNVRVICPGSIQFPRVILKKSYCIISVDKKTINNEYFYFN